MEKWVVSAKRADFEQLANKFGIDPVIADLSVTGIRLQTEKLTGICTGSSQNYIPGNC